MEDLEYMRLALELAWKGSGFVNPNPMVGAVVVKDGAIIGQGYHQRYGGLHAERNALADCRISPRGAALYVTLEPCCHYGKTPPCTEAILEAGIARVIVGTLDPNPVMAGRSVGLLREKGIEVEVGVLEAECRELIRPFAKYITTGRPWVLMKYAMTLDGKIATAAGHSRWITGEAARMEVQCQRQRLSAIMVGVNTILEDDPILTCRLEKGRNPIRIICDTHLRTPLSSRIVATAGEVRTILAVGQADPERAAVYRERGLEVLEAGERDGHVDLVSLLERLGKEGIDSILLEGGAALNWSALQQGLVDEVHTYIAPKIFGGEGAKTPVSGPGAVFPADAFGLRIRRVVQVDDDYRIESEPVKQG